MTAAHLAMLAAAAYGHGWQRALARAIGVRGDTVHRWSRGDPRWPITAARAMQIKIVCLAEVRKRVAGIICQECGIQVADWPAPLCQGCAAYREHEA